MLKQNPKKKQKESDDIRAGLKTYNTKTKVTGEITTTITYDRHILTGYERRHTPMRKPNRDKANEQNAKRAKKQVHDIVNTNWTKYTKMITMTYRETTLDYDTVAHDFKMFRKALQRRGYDFPYLTIIEHQIKRGKKEGNAGSLHIHCLAFTDRYIPFETLKSVWTRLGSVQIEKLDKAENKGAYVAKYITKEALPPDKKSYRTSRNIKKPTIMVGSYEQSVVLDNIMESHNLISYVDYTIKGSELQDGTIEELNHATGFVYESRVKGGKINEKT